MKPTAWILFVAAVAATLGLPTVGRAQSVPPGGGANSQSTMGGTGPLKDELTDEVRARVKMGLDWLAKHQSPDGTFPEGGMGDSAGITALAGLAFLADGNMPEEGPYAKNVASILDFVLKNCQESGLITSQGYGSPMYGHGFATLFLAEVYGQTGRPDVKEKLQNAVRLIVQTQNKQGGWRYQPVPEDADLSVTICEVMALRAARNAGIKVPPATIARALDYVKKSQEPDGGFSYTLGGGGSAFPRSAAGVACLYYLGDYRAEEIQKGLKYLMQRAPGQTDGEGNYFYGNYYGTQANFMAGGTAWAKYWPALRSDLLKKQQKDGCWQGEAGAAYATSMALIMLQVPNRLLPILQK